MLSACKGEWFIGWRPSKARRARVLGPVWGGVKCARARAQVADRRFAVGRRLIDERHFAHRAREFGEREIFANLERVETDARHESDLVVEEMAGRPNFAFEAQPRAQHARPGKGASVAELGKFQH